MGVVMAWTSPWAYSSSQPSQTCVIFRPVEGPAAAAPGFVSQKIVEPRHDRFLRHGTIGVEIELGLQVLGQRGGHKGCVCPGLTVYSGGAHLGSRGLGHNGGTDGNACIHVFGNPNRRHGVAVTTGVSDDLHLYTGRIGITGLVVVGNGLASRVQREFGCDMGTSVMSFVHMPW